MWVHPVFFPRHNFFYWLQLLEIPWSISFCLPGHRVKHEQHFIHKHIRRRFRPSRPLHLPSNCKHHHDVCAWYTGGATTSFSSFTPLAVPLWRLVRYLKCRPHRHCAQAMGLRQCRYDDQGLASVPCVVQLRFSCVCTRPERTVSGKPSKLK